MPQERPKTFSNTDLGAPGLLAGAGQSARKHLRRSLSELDRLALDAAYGMALKSLSEGGLPIGSALVDADGRIVAVGHNLRVQEGDPTAHAEMACVRRAGRRTDWHTLTMATTLSPCAMCSGTAVLYKIPRIVIGENRNFVGREDWLTARGTEIVLADDARCVGMMSKFIRENPELWDEDIGVVPRTKRRSSGR